MKLKGNGLKKAKPKGKRDLKKRARKTLAAKMNNNGGRERERERICRSDCQVRSYKADY